MKTHHRHLQTIGMSNKRKKTVTDEVREAQKICSIIISMHLLAGSAIQPNQLLFSIRFFKVFGVCSEHLLFLCWFLGVRSVLRTLIVFELVFLFLFRCSECTPNTYCFCAVFFGCSAQSGTAFVFVQIFFLLIFFLLVKFFYRIFLYVIMLGSS